MSFFRKTYTEDEIIAHLTSGDPLKEKRMTSYLYDDTELRRTWFGSWRKHFPEQAQDAFHDALTTFVHRVKEHQYEPQNWRGFCVRIAGYKLITQLNKDGENKEIPSDELEKYQLLANEETERIPPHSLYPIILELLSSDSWFSKYRTDQVILLRQKGMEYQDIKQRLKNDYQVERKKQDLRQDYQRGMDRLQETLAIRLSKRHLKEMPWCKISTCDTLVQTKWEGGKWPAISKQVFGVEHNINVRTPINKAQECYQKCLLCLIKYFINS